jgi:hypothetical protein
VNYVLLRVKKMNKNHSNLLAALVALTLCDAPVLARGVGVRSKSSQTRQQVQTAQSKAAAQPRKKPWTAAERAQKEEEVVDIINDALGAIWEGGIDRIQDFVRSQSDAALVGIWNLDPHAVVQAPRNSNEDDRNDVREINEALSDVATQWNQLFRSGRRQSGQPILKKTTGSVRVLEPSAVLVNRVSEMIDFCNDNPTVYRRKRQDIDGQVSRAIMGVSLSERNDLVDAWNSVKEEIEKGGRVEQSQAKKNRILLRDLKRSDQYDRVSQVHFHKIIDEINYLHAYHGEGQGYDTNRLLEDLNVASEDENYYLMPQGTFGDLLHQGNRLRNDYGRSRKTRYGKFTARRTGADEEWDRKWNKKHAGSKRHNYSSDDFGQDKNQSSSDFDASSKPRLAIKPDFDFEDTTLDMAFDALGLSKDATQKDVTKAFRKLSLKHHPDKGGDTEKFQKISRANDRLEEYFKRGY